MRERIGLGIGIGLGVSRVMDFFAVWKNKMVNFHKESTEVRKGFKSLAHKQ